MTRFAEPHILVIVDDDEDIGELIGEKINQMFPDKFDISVFEDPSAALEFVEKHDARVLISDIHMPGMYGDIFLNKCRDLEKGIMTITMTGYPNFTKAIMRYRDGDIGFLVKPIDYDKLKMYLEMCLSSLKTWEELIKSMVTK